MSALIFESLVQLYRRRKGLLIKKYEADFEGSYAESELYWNETLIDKFLGRCDISEITDDLKNRRIEIKK